MRGFSSSRSFETENPKALRNVLEKDADKELPWGAEIAIFEKKAEEIKAGHLLVLQCEKVVGNLMSEFGSIDKTPRDRFSVISEKTGYQEGLIAAICKKIWEEKAGNNNEN